MAVVPSIRIRVQTTPKVRIRVTPALIPLNATVAVGEVTTLAPGAPATIVNVGTPSAVVLDFGVPTGPSGADGADGLPGAVQAIVAGDNVSVDSTDPANPVVSATGDVTAAQVAAGYQPLDADLTAIAAIATTTYGRALLALANSTALSGQLSAFYQPLDGDLTSWAAITRASGFDAFAATPSSANLRALLTDEVGAGAAYFIGGALGTPASGTATNLTGLPVSTGISGLGASVATFLATPSSANLRAALTDEVGTGAAYFVGGALGTPASLALTNATGLPITGITSSTSAQLAALLSDETGTGAAVFGTSPTIAGTPVFSGIPSLTGGGLKFPATDIPSADPNTFDDYEEGTWTPVLTFATPGDLAVTYTTQAGTYTKKGREVTLSFNAVTSSFTYTTAALGIQMTGSPFTNSAAGARFGSLSWGGVTKAGYTQLNPRIPPSQSFMVFQLAGSGVSPVAASTTDVPSGGTVSLQGTMLFEV